MNCFMLDEGRPTRGHCLKLWETLCKRAPAISLSIFSDRVVNRWNLLD